MWQTIKKYRNPALILAFTLVSYGNSLRNEFAWDDIDAIVRNPLIKDWGNLHLLLTSGFWASIGTNAGIYRPLTTVSFLCEYSVVGLNPLLYHLDNIILHFFCSLLVYLLVGRFFKEGLTPLFSAILFAVHPVHTEAVSWVVGRAEILSVFFFLASFYAFLSFERKKLSLVLAPALLFLGVCSKETAVTLPIFIIIYLLLFERDGRGKYLSKIALNVLPFFLAAGVFFIIRYLALRGEVSPVSYDQALYGISPTDVFLIMMKALTYYIRLLFFPTGLLVFYMFSVPGFFSPPFIIAAMAFAANFASIPYLLKRNRALLLFAVLFFVALLPVSNIIPIGIVMSERALYLPSVSFCVVTAWLISASMKNYKAWGYIFFLLIVSFFCILTVLRNPVWRDNQVALTELAEVYKKDAGELRSSGLYFKLYSFYMALDREGEAEWALKKSLEVDRDKFQSHILLAELYEKQGKIGRAYSEINAALPYENKFEHYDYGDLARLYFVLNKIPESEAFFKKAFSMKPDFGLYYFNYSELLLKRGDREGALQNLGKAALYQPRLAGECYFRQGVILGEDGRYADAVDALRRAVRAVPENPIYHVYLGAAYAGIGQKRMASQEAETALKINPDLKEALDLSQSLK